jgi:hypothetical protein
MAVVTAATTGVRKVAHWAWTAVVELAAQTAVVSEGETVAMMADSTASQWAAC